ncbi:MAG: hypothetical protein J6D37_01255 [Clostridia bacterium]|nr:hypothetical protein [Clostridia bacterium]
MWKMRKITKYLNSKAESEYTMLDRLLKQYLDGELEMVLKRYGFTKIEIFSKIGKRENDLQIYFRYYNFALDIDFSDRAFDYTAYLPGISAEEYENSIIRCNYEKNFSFEGFVARLQSELSQDTRLKK